MPHKKSLVTLTDEERQWLTGLVSAGKRSARTIPRARILLKADQADGGPAWEDAEIADALDGGRRTVERVRRRFVERGLEPALGRKPRTGRAASVSSTGRPKPGSSPSPARPRRTAGRAGP